MAILDSLLYQSKLDEAKFAVVELQKAKSFLADNKIYLSYLASHSLYRTLPTNESKEVLLNVGAQLRYLLDVQTNIVKSFDSLPISLSLVISEYQNQPVLEWDVIKVNNLIEQLGIAAKYLNSSLTLLERENRLVLSPEITEWQLAIRNQLKMIKQVGHYVIHLALSSSAIALEILNADLTENSANLLSLVREELAQETMQPYFNKANQAYQPYFNLNENLALASSTARRNTHASWYKGWSHIEKEVLESRTPFSTYPITSSNRANKLRTFINKVNNMKPNSELGFTSLTMFKMQYDNVYNLIDKLNKDRTLLNYG